MSNYTTKNRELMQKLYGYYINMCKKLNIQQVTFNNFDINTFNITTSLYNKSK